MKSLNKVQFIGNIVADAVTKTTGETTKTSFKIAVNRDIKDKDEADFIWMAIWGERGTKLEKYLTKGRKLYVEGKLRISSTELPDGTFKNFTDVLVDELMFLDFKEEEA